MISNIPELSTQNMVDLLENPQYSIIDARTVDAYNGWTPNGEKRGGHIKGARCLPVKWLKYIDWIEIVRSKGILPEQHIVVYSNSQTDAEHVAIRFQKSGYHKVSIYPYFIDEWSSNTNLPIDKLKRFDQLVSPNWLNAALNNEKPEHFKGEKLVLCHAHYRNVDDYHMGHIPGAIEMDTNYLESPETWNRRSPEELKAVLEKKGITKNTTVVVYGRFSFPNNDDPFPGSSAGHLGAIRCAFILMYAGVKDVKILNGGLQSWLDNGFEVTTNETKSVPVGDCGLNIPERPELAVDVPEAMHMIASSMAELVCVRSYPEYIGEVSGYNYIEKKGRIPGAVFANCGTDAYHMENYRHLDHTTREFNEVKTEWEQSGITADKHCAFYCGTGWRGSEAWLSAYLMGWPKASVFDGGWFEWSKDGNNPYETGIPAK